MMALAICASHTPLLKEGEASEATRDKVRSGFAALERVVRDYQPDCIVQFAPDHFNGFFYDLMPPFCVGAGAEAIGDWGCAAGPLPVDEEFAMQLVNAVRAADIDVAVSYKMMLDHGFIQMWEAIFGRYDPYPIVPIFINGAAPPVPTYRRARMLGEAVGRFVASSGRRVLFAASGGLSHDPPMPEITGASPEVRARLINNRDPTPEARAMREQRVLEAGTLAARGEGPCQPLNPEWDQAFLASVRAGDMAALGAMDASEVRRVAGRGGNEVLSWVAALSALSAAGAYEVTSEWYEPIPGWIAGMAMVSARTKAA